MTTDSTSDAITTGALLVGGGVAGYFGGRWLAEGWRESDDDTTASAPITSSASAPQQPAPLVGAMAAPLPAPAPSLTPFVPSASWPAPSHPPPARSPRPPREPSPVSSPDQVTAAPVLPPAREDGPVTSPDQVPATARPARPAGALPRTFDSTFDRLRGAIPIEYLRALAHAESGLNPRARSRTGARGLLQITKSVRLGFNKAHGTHHKPEDLDDPTINTSIACWLLRFIAASYAKNHPTVPNMRTDWRNPRFAALLTLGWNGGFSEAGGVGLVVAHLQKRGAVDIDVELVHGHARAAGAAKYLSDPRRLAWCKRVVTLYLREHALAEPIATPVA